MAGFTLPTARRTYGLTARCGGMRMTGYYETGIRMAKRRYRRVGMVLWFDDKGRLHREDGPASIWPDGTQYWYRRGRDHFAHGPSDLWADGLVRWYEDNKYLREREPYG